MKHALFALGLCLVCLLSAGEALGKENKLLAAETYYRAGEFAQSQACVEEVLRAEPGNVLAHYLLGNILARQGSTEEARVHYQWVLSSGYPDAVIRRYSLIALEQLPDAFGAKLAGYTAASNGAINEQERTINAERDQRIAEITRESDRKIQGLEEEMRSSISGNFGYRFRGWSTLNADIRQDYNGRIEAIRQEARRHSEEVTAASAERIRALEGSASNSYK